MMWQPIETAPKDHTNILLAYRVEHGDELWVGNGYYETGLMSDGIYVGWMCEDMENCIPTHWMPLPDPPALGEKKDD